MTILNGNTKHGAFSLASLAVLASLVMPQSQAQASNTDFIAPPSSPPPAAQLVDQSEIYESARLPNLDSLEFHKETQVRIAETARESKNISDNDQAVSNGGSAVAGWAIAAAMAVWKFGQQMLSQARALISKNLLDKGKNVLLSKFKGGKTELDTASVPISLVHVNITSNQGETSCEAKPIPFQPDTVGELFTNPKNFRDFEKAFLQCSEKSALPTLNLERGEKPHTYKGLLGINEVIWETVSRYFTDKPREFLKPPAGDARENYLVIPTCNFSEDPTEGNSLAILLVKETDLQKIGPGQNDELLSLLRTARKANDVRKRVYPEKPLFRSLAA